ncbi:MAG TPA: transcription antitermination factor NusB [Cycloclasticus sp.]|jgi:N utilization substance protein B|nr:transcription antitermination factor NusB [Cycloclasticus sp.]HIL92638.1 transcription antitermination factor NusB [Cycloclasticus sp.]
MSSAKSSSRQVALQALYQWQVTGQNLEELQRQFEENPEIPKFQKSYFQLLLNGVVNKLGELDEALNEFTDRELEKVDPIEKAILRLGAYELMFKPDVPYRVAINEFVNLAKSFGSEKSHAYVNSILDKVAKKSRSLEIKANFKRKKKTG